MIESMASPAPNLYAQTELLKDRANRLLSKITHDSMRAQVREAVDDIDEALSWLGDAEKSEHLKAEFREMANRTLQCADWRLHMIEKALKDNGPDSIPEWDKGITEGITGRSSSRKSL